MHGGTALFQQARPNGTAPECLPNQIKGKGLISSTNGCCRAYPTSRPMAPTGRNVLIQAVLSAWPSVSNVADTLR